MIATKLLYIESTAYEESNDTYIAIVSLCDSGLNKGSSKINTIFVIGAQ